MLARASVTGLREEEDRADTLAIEWFNAVFS